MDMPTTYLIQVDFMASLVGTLLLHKAWVMVLDAISCLYFSNLENLVRHLHSLSLLPFSLSFMHPNGFIFISSKTARYGILKTSVSFLTQPYGTHSPTTAYFLLQSKTKFTQKLRAAFSKFCSYLSQYF
jgi:hypothetical protein